MSLFTCLPHFFRVSSSLSMTVSPAPICVWLLFLRSALSLTFPSVFSRFYSVPFFLKLPRGLSSCVSDPWPHRVSVFLRLPHLSRCHLFKWGCTVTQGGWHDRRGVGCLDCYVHIHTPRPSLSAFELMIGCVCCIYFNQLYSACMCTCVCARYCLFIKVQDCLCARQYVC